MQWTQEQWMELRSSMIRTARARGATFADAEDMASEVAAALVNRAAEVRDPEAYAWGAFRNQLMQWMRGRYKPGVPLEHADGVPDVAPPAFETRQRVMRYLRLTTAIQHVLEFGRLQQKGTTTLLLRESRFDPGCLELELEYLYKVLEEAPVAARTRRRAQDTFTRLLTRALERVKVDARQGPADEEPPDMDTGAYVLGDEERRMLSGNAVDAVDLLLLLFPRMTEPVAMEHALAVQDDVWQGRDRGVSYFTFEFDDQHPSGTEDLDDLDRQLRRLWRWEHGGELLVTAGARPEVSVRVTAAEGDLLVEVPASAECFADPPSAGGVQVLLHELDYDPPCDEIDTYNMELTFTGPHQMIGVARLIFNTLERAYGCDPDDGVAWVCDYDKEEAA